MSMTNETEHNDNDGFKRIRVGISSCLLGEEVRFDGGHKRDAYVVGTLSEYFDFVPVCPEEAIGLGTPREPIRLVQKADGVHVVGVKTVTRDVTEALRAYGEKMAGRMTDISGYILKRASPSCGMERVKVYTEAGMPVTTASGKYAEAFMQAQPLLPVEEEGRLGDPVLRENFIVRVFVYHRWQTLVTHGLTAQALIDFHTDHKYLLMAHDQNAYREMGRLVAQAGNRPLDELANDYVTALMTALRTRATRRQHVNVLQHLFGYVSKHVDAADRAEMIEIIDHYRDGLVPLIVPITLLKHHFRRHPDPYIERQVYLSPHPKELMLRNLL
ncbi:MAG TPA: DUF1722 domain-containing protein [Thioalkalivibrio sp.]|nr:DUF1722 domain-containing protein [Thioalkalivibrio sp.]